MWRALGRLLLVPIGFALAVVTALLVAFSLGLEKLAHAMHGTPAGIETVDAYATLALDGLALLAGLSIVPALLVVIVGEIARIRSWLYYVVGGGCSLGMLPLLTGLTERGATDLPPAALWHVLATAGFAGGLVYWLVAGRRA